MRIKVKTNINTKKIMSDIEKQTKNAIKSGSYDIECPYCNKTFSAHSGHNVCPYCRNNVTLNLNIDF